jgi:cephalosporin hydroxylase
MRTRAGRAVATNLFQRAYYEGARAWEESRWLGTRALKAPQDLWLYQEIVSELRPGLIVETGTFEGGSALYLATVCEAIGHGEVVTVDVRRRGDLPRHERIVYVVGSSTDPEVVARVQERARAAEGVLVILDSDHSRDHVLGELRAYGPLVSPGGYAIVEDTNINGHPVARHWGPGPMEAVDAYLAEGAPFEIDRGREKFLFTCNPRGFLRRT